MDKKLTSVEVYFMVKELQILLDAKVDQVYGDEQEVLFSLHKSEFGKQFLKIKSEVLYLTKDKDIQNETPTQFCTTLRKLIVNSRIKSISQVESERIIDIELYFKENSMHLIIELFGGGNVLLIKDAIILAVKTQKKFTGRTIAPKEKYEYPKQRYNFTKITKEELKNLLLTSDKENIVKTLAVDLFLGGLYAEEVLAIAKEDKNKKSKEVDSNAIYYAIKDLLSSNLKPNKINDNLVPVEISSVPNEKIVGDKTYYDSFSLAISKNESIESRSAKEKEIHTIFDKKIDKLQSIIKLQNIQIEKLKKDAEGKKIIGDMIRKNYAFIEKEINKSKEQKFVVDLD